MSASKTGQESATTALLPSRETVSFGLALFSMYFGAGNLIFPMLIGSEAGANNFYALLGLACTAVLFPLLGLFAMMLFDGKQKPFFATLGARAGFLTFFAIQLIVGPLYTTPRLFALMWGSFQQIVPTCPKWLFFTGAIAAIFYCTQKNSRMIQVLGLVLTPLLILSLAILIGVGLYHPPALQLTSLNATTSFQTGFSYGYNTMDLIASFLFAGALLPGLRELARGSAAPSRERFIGREMMKAGSIAALLLVISYAGLSYLAAHYSYTLPADLPKEQWLGAIAERLLGPFGATVASAAVLLACLTTAISLVSIFSTYLREEVLSSKVPQLPIVIATLLTAAFIGSHDFASIFSAFVPILNVIYPGLILLCLFNIAEKLELIPKKNHLLFRWPILASFAYGFWTEILAPNF